MRLQKLNIHNYRSIHNIDIDCQNMVTLLGPNNHGKSNILSALDFALSTSAKPTHADFFTHRDEDVFWVEMTFCNLTEQEKTTFKRYVRANGTICVRKTARQIDDAFETSYNGWIEQPEEPWLRTDNSGDYTSREKISATPLVDFVPPEGRITKPIVENAQQNFIQQKHMVTTEV